MTIKHFLASALFAGAGIASFASPTSDFDKTLQPKKYRLGPIKSVVVQDRTAKGSGAEADCGHLAIDEKRVRFFWRMPGSAASINTARNCRPAIATHRPGCYSRMAEPPKSPSTTGRGGARSRPGERPTFCGAKPAPTSWKAAFHSMPASRPGPESVWRSNAPKHSFEWLARKAHRTGAAITITP